MYAYVTIVIEYFSAFWLVVLFSRFAL